MENLDIDLLKKSYRCDGYAVILDFLYKGEIGPSISALGNTIRERPPLMPTNHVVYEDPTDKAALNSCRICICTMPSFQSSYSGANFKPSRRQ